MEYVVISTALSRIAVNLIDRYEASSASQRQLQEHLQEEQRKASGAEDQRSSLSLTSSVPARNTDDDSAMGGGTPVQGAAGDGVGGANGGGAGREGDGDTTGGEATVVEDEDTVEAVRARIKTLRAEAGQLTSADTFVQYARVTRRVTKLEKRLRKLEGEAAGDADASAGMDVERMARALTAAFSSQATRSTRARTRLSGGLFGKLLIRVALFALLWARFSASWSTGSLAGGGGGMLSSSAARWTAMWSGGGGAAAAERGDVMQVACHAVRPVAWLFRRRPARCEGGDWACAATAEDMCGVSFMFAATVCNAAMAVVVDAVMDRFLVSVSS